MNASPRSNPVEIILAGHELKLDVIEKGETERQVNEAIAFIESLEGEAATFEKDYEVSIAMSRNQDDRVDFVKRGMKGMLTGSEGVQLKDALYELVQTINTERKKQGKALYRSEATLMLVCEVIYRALLWRNIGRKGGGSYFMQHLMEAAFETVRNGFTSLQAILSALAHDDIEDLLVHRNGSNPSSKESGFKEEWLFCSEIYQDSIDRSEVPGIQETLCRVKAEVVTIVRAMTLQSGGTQTVEKDNEKLLSYLENLRGTFRAALIKVLEQVSNTLSLDGLSVARREVKLKSILKLHGLMTKVLGLTVARQAIVGVGVDYLQPELRTEYENLKVIRYQKTLNLKDGESVEDAKVLKEICNSLNGVLGVNSIRFNEASLEDLVEIEDLVEGKANLNNLIPNNPLCEIVILVSSSDQIAAVATAVFSKLNISRSGEQIRYKQVAKKDPPGGRASEGGLILCENPPRPPIKIRINTEKEEARRKRGIYGAPGKEEEAVRWLRPRVTRVIGEIELQRMMMQAMQAEDQTNVRLLDLVSQILLRPTIQVKNANAGKEHWYMPSGSSVLDYAASIREDGYFLIHGARAFIVEDTGRRVPISFLDTLEPDVRYLIEVGSDPSVVQIDVSEMSFASHPRTVELCQKYWQTKGEATQEANIHRARGYLSKLKHLLGLDDRRNADAEIMLMSIWPFLIGDKSQWEEHAVTALKQIGFADFDPLKAIAPLVSQGSTFAVRLQLKNEVGVVQALTKSIKSEGVNLNFIDAGSPSEFPSEDAHSVPGRFEFRIADPVTPFRALQLLLKLSHQTLYVNDIALNVHSLFDLSRIPDYQAKLDFCRDFWTKYDTNES